MTSSSRLRYLVRFKPIFIYIYIDAFLFEDIVLKPINRTFILIMESILLRMLIDISARKLKRQLRLHITQIRLCV